MSSMPGVFRVVGGCVCLTGALAAVAILRQSSVEGPISPEALRQIAALLREKDARGPAQRKVSSGLLHQQSSGSNLLVDVKATVSTGLLSGIRRAGGTVVYVSARAGQVRARVPANSIEALAARPDVASIRAAALPRVVDDQKRNAQLRPALGGFLNKFAEWNPLEAALLAAGSLTTQGDITHSARIARSTYGVDGTGVRVGVLSDSAEATPMLIGTGDLPAGTTIVQDLIDGPGSSEGTAIMEIVHDIAPGAELFFASSFNSDSSFADNIRTLRSVYHCDIIVDDTSYSNEPPFQDGPIAQAVNDVTADGAVYISAGGQNGNLTSGTSSVWEGDFTPGGGNALLPGYTLHSFGVQAFNRLLLTTGDIELFWSDPLGASSNDYDLFLLNPAGTAVLKASTTVQNGAGFDPSEEIFSALGFPANSRIVIAAKAGALPRALRLQAFFGERLQFVTNGAVGGHQGAASAIAVAPVAWNSARMGTRPFVGGAKNPTEIFAADGPRKQFYSADGTPVTPGNLLFGTNGGTTIVKPDIAAADGVTVRTPGFNPFYSSAAAAAHAAGIAALIKSAKPSLTPAEIRNALTSTALDIRAIGVDRDGGYGLIMAPPALAKALQ